MCVCVCVCVCACYSVVERSKVITSLEDLVSVGMLLAVRATHLVHLLGWICPGLQGDREGSTMVNPAVVIGATEPSVCVCVCVCVCVSVCVNYEILWTTPHRLEWCVCFAYLTTNMPSPGCFFMMLSGMSSVSTTSPGHHLHTHTHTHTRYNPPTIMLPGNVHQNAIRYTIYSSTYTYTLVIKT